MRTLAEKRQKRTKIAEKLVAMPDTARALIGMEFFDFPLIKEMAAAWLINSARAAQGGAATRGIAKVTRQKMPDNEVKPESLKMREYRAAWKRKAEALLADDGQR